MDIEAKYIDEFVVEFINRTKKNLDIYLQNPLAKYEVTQTINSMYGILVISYDKIFKNMKKKSVLNKTVNQQFLSEIQDIITLTLTEDSEPSDSLPSALSFFEIINGLRNALAHGSIKFLSSDNKLNEIETVRFSSEIREGKVAFEVELGIGVIKQLIEEIINVIPVAVNNLKNRNHY